MAFQVTSKKIVILISVCSIIMLLNIRTKCLFQYSRNNNHAKIMFVLTLIITWGKSVKILKTINKLR